MLNTTKFKKFAMEAGADVVRIGSMANWEGAPPEMDPRHLLPEAKALIGLAFRIPRGYLRGIEEGTFFSLYENMGYSGMNVIFTPIVLRQIVDYIEDHGYEAVPLPNYDPWANSNASDYKNPNLELKNIHSRPVAPGKPAPDVAISTRAAAVISNLGEIGWSKMILTPEFGPLIRAMFIVTEAPLEFDEPIKPGTLCDRCMLCAKNCTGNAIPTDRTKCIRHTIAGMEIEHCDLNLARCSNAYSGANPKYNPFWDHSQETPDESFMEEYLSPGYFGRPKGKGGPCSGIMRVRNNPAIEGGRGCLRACYAHLESQGKLTRKFYKPFKRHPEWTMKEGEPSC